MSEHENNLASAMIQKRPLRWATILMVFIFVLIFFCITALYLLLYQNNTFAHFDKDIIQNIASYIGSAFGLSASLAGAVVAIFIASLAHDIQRKTNARENAQFLAEIASVADRYLGDYFRFISYLRLKWETIYQHYVALETSMKIRGQEAVAEGITKEGFAIQSFKEEDMNHRKAISHHLSELLSSTNEFYKKASACSKEQIEKKIRFPMKDFEVGLSFLTGQISIRQAQMETQQYSTGELWYASLAYSQHFVDQSGSRIKNSGIHSVLSMSFFLSGANPVIAKALVDYLGTVFSNDDIEPPETLSKICWMIAHGHAVPIAQDVLKKELKVLAGGHLGQLGSVLRDIRLLEPKSTIPAVTGMLR